MIHQIWWTRWELNPIFLIAKEVLSQLSYRPIDLVEEVGLEPTRPKAPPYQRGYLSNLYTLPVLFINTLYEIT